MTEVVPSETFRALRPLMEARGYQPGGPLTGIEDATTELARLRDAVPDVRAEIQRSGMPDAVATCDLITLPYPTRFGLWRAAITPAPFLWFVNRMLVVQWTEDEGRRTLLWEPTDFELGGETPFYARLRARSVVPERFLARRHGTVLDHLAALGVRPEDVDYLVFDHLHTQDVRRLVGTNGPAPGLGAATEPVRPWFPDARLVCQRREWDAARNPHPLQAAWYQPETYRDVRTEAVEFIDGDVVLGPGVALLYTPGHTLGNMSLVLNTHGGLWTSSENGIAAECYVPEASRIPGVRRWARSWGQEVVMNANVLEYTAWQYNSMVVEKLVADPASRAPFRQTFPSSELTAHPMSPGTRPTFTHHAIRHGVVRPSLTD